VLGGSLLVALVTIAGGVSASATVAPMRGSAASMRQPQARTTKRRSAIAPPLVFGIYPGGAAGTVGPSPTAKPEDPALRMAALEQLQPHGRPFVLHLYASYSGANGSSADEQVGQQIEAYGKAGFETELVLAYRPADGGSADDVAGFVSFVRDAVRSLGPMAGFASLQVTNEANVGGSPNASDGYYADAKDALIAGVIAAKRESRRNGLNRVNVGFNWADADDPSESAFWRYLGRHGGRQFVSALDWVGLDAYPGTWGPRLGPGAIAASTTNFIDEALRRLRTAYLPLAGIPRTVPLRVTENGYPTGPGRSDTAQVTVMKAGVWAVYRARRAYNVTGYNWFDLRDANSSSSSFESQYGIMRDDYSPKPAFGAYRALVASLSN
jgi:hypothetical protein